MQKNTFVALSSVLDFKYVITKIIVWKYMVPLKKALKTAEAVLFIICSLASPRLKSWASEAEKDKTISMVLNDHVTFDTPQN